MRVSVLFCDIVILVPSLILALKYLKIHMSLKNSTFGVIQLVTLLAPPLILIDHGHFQYNGVCIGLTILAAIALVRDYDVVASILFSLSLNFKQMALYYAPVFFLLCFASVLIREQLARLLDTFF